LGVGSWELTRDQKGRPPLSHPPRIVDPMHTQPVSAALSSIVIAKPVSFENLAMFPLVARDAADIAAAGAEMPSTDYLTLDESLSARQVEITEVSEQGRVPELRVINRGGSPVLVVDGEELVGAKQNRVVNLSILVPPASNLTIPVSCVEAGRWRAKSRKFSSAPRTQYSSGRAKRMAKVSDSIAAAGRHYSDQSEVWADIAQMSARLRTSSPTGAMEALFVEHAPFIDRCVAACQPVDGQVGALFAINSRIIGFDLFDRERTLRVLLPKLVRSVAVDALDHRRDAASPRLTDADKGSVTFATALFLGAVGTAWCHVTPGVGLGQDLRLTGQGVTGAALVNEGRVIHLSAFAVA
jgi:hypothetical protein